MTLLARAKKWVYEAGVPFWLLHGLDRERGGFYESFSLEGGPLDEPKRAMVQARQVYCFRVASELHACDSEAGRQAVRHGMNFLLQNHSLGSGAFAHSTDREGRIKQPNPDLYAQAFALFGLSQAYAFDSRKEDYRKRGKALLGYLNSERKAPHGGFTELKDGQTLFLSNPQMHLLEAAIGWMEIDSDPCWRSLAQGLIELCLTKLIDPESGLLGERFDSNWSPIRTAGRFVFEPGHQYEWAWLLGRHDRLSGGNLRAVRQRLFRLSEENGICPKRRTAFDELWSDLETKTRSSRLWPQCERIKAALLLANEIQPDRPGSADRQFYLSAADEALTALLRYLETPTPGLWHDVWTDQGELVAQPARASSLYHILGALSAYLKERSSE